MTGDTTQDWTVRQLGLDGEAARGQATLDGDVVTPGEEQRRRFLDEHPDQDLDGEATKEVVLDFETYCELQRGLLELDDTTGDDRYAAALEQLVAAWNNGTRTEVSDA